MSKFKRSLAWNSNCSCIIPHFTAHSLADYMGLDPSSRRIQAVIVGGALCSIALLIVSQITTLFNITYYGGIVVNTPKYTTLQYNLWDSVITLWENDSQIIAVLVIIFSGVWPYLKNLALIASVFVPRIRSIPPRVQYRLAFFLYYFGKWSYIDIWVASTVLVVMQFYMRSALVLIEIETAADVGVYFYLAGAILSQLVSLLHRASQEHAMFTAWAHKRLARAQGRDARYCVAPAPFPQTVTRTGAGAGITDGPPGTQPHVRADEAANAAMDAGAGTSAGDGVLRLTSGALPRAGSVAPSGTASSADTQTHTQTPTQPQTQTQAGTRSIGAGSVAGAGGSGDVTGGVSTCGDADSALHRDSPLTCTDSLWAGAGAREAEGGHGDKGVAREEEAQEQGQVQAARAVGARGTGHVHDDADGYEGDEDAEVYGEAAGGEMDYEDEEDAGYYDAENEDEDEEEVGAGWADPRASVVSIPQGFTLSSARCSTAAFHAHLLAAAQRMARESSMGGMCGGVTSDGGECALGAAAETEEASERVMLAAVIRAGGLRALTAPHACGCLCDAACEQSGTACVVCEDVDSGAPRKNLLFTASGVPARVHVVGHGVRGAAGVSSEVATGTCAAAGESEADAERAAPGYGVQDTGAPRRGSLVLRPGDVCGDMHSGGGTRWVDAEANAEATATVIAAVAAAAGAGAGRGMGLYGHGYACTGAEEGEPSVPSHTATPQSLSGGGGLGAGAWVCAWPTGPDRAGTDWAGLDGAGVLSRASSSSAGTRYSQALVEGLDGVRRVVSGCLDIDTLLRTGGAGDTGASPWGVGIEGGPGVGRAENAEVDAILWNSAARGSVLSLAALGVEVDADVDDSCQGGDAGVCGDCKGGQDAHEYAGYDADDAEHAEAEEEDEVAPESDVPPRHTRRSTRSGVRNQHGKSASAPSTPLHDAQDTRGAGCSGDCEAGCDGQCGEHMEAHSDGYDDGYGDGARGEYYEEVYSDEDEDGCSYGDSGAATDGSRHSYGKENGHSGPRTWASVVAGPSAHVPVADLGACASRMAAALNRARTAALFTALARIHAVDCPCHPLATLTALHREEQEAAARGAHKVEGRSVHSERRRTRSAGQHIHGSHANATYPAAASDAHDACAEWCNDEYASAVDHMHQYTHHHHQVLSVAPVDSLPDALPAASAGDLILPLPTVSPDASHDTEAVPPVWRTEDGAVMSPAAILRSAGSTRTPEERLCREEVLQAALHAIEYHPQLGLVCIGDPLALDDVVLCLDDVVLEETRLSPSLVRDLADPNPSEWELDTCPRDEEPTGPFDFALEQSESEEEEVPTRYSTVLNLPPHSELESRAIRAPRWLRRLRAWFAEKKAGVPSDLVPAHRRDVVARLQPEFSVSRVRGSCTRASEDGDIEARAGLSAAAGMISPAESSASTSTSSTLSPSSGDEDEPSASGSISGSELGMCADGGPGCVKMQPMQPGTRVQPMASIAESPTEIHTRRMTPRQVPARPVASGTVVDGVNTTTAALPMATTTTTTTSSSSSSSNGNGGGWSWFSWPRLFSSARTGTDAAGASATATSTAINDGTSVAHAAGDAAPQQASPHTPRSVTDPAAGLHLVAHAVDADIAALEAQLPLVGSPVSASPLEQKLRAAAAAGALTGTSPVSGEASEAAGLGGVVHTPTAKVEREYGVDSYEYDGEYKDSGDYADEEDHGEGNDDMYEYDTSEDVHSSTRTPSTHNASRCSTSTALRSSNTAPRGAGTVTFSDTPTVVEYSPHTGSPTSSSNSFASPVAAGSTAASKDSTHSGVTGDGIESSLTGTAGTSHANTDLTDATQPHKTADKPNKPPRPPHRYDPASLAGKRHLLPPALNLYGVEVDEVLMGRVADYQVQRVNAMLERPVRLFYLSSAVSVVSALALLVGLMMPLYSITIDFVRDRKAYIEYWAKDYIGTLIQQSHINNRALAVIAAILIFLLPVVHACSSLASVALRVAVLRKWRPEALASRLHLLRLAQTVASYTAPWCCLDTFAVALLVSTKELPLVVNRYGDKKLIYYMDALPGLYIMIAAGALALLAAYPTKRWGRVPVIALRLSFPHVHYVPLPYEDHVRLGAPAAISKAVSKKRSVRASPVPGLNLTGLNAGDAGIVDAAASALVEHDAALRLAHEEEEKAVDWPALPIGEDWMGTGNSTGADGTVAGVAGAGVAGGDTTTHVSASSV